MRPITEAAKILHRNDGRAQIAPGRQCLGALAATPTLLNRPTAEITVRSWLCGSEANAIGANTSAALPKKNGIAQQVAKANAAAIPPATRATAPVDLRLSFMGLC